MKSHQGPRPHGYFIARLLGAGGSREMFIKLTLKACLIYLNEEIE